MGSKRLYTPVRNTPIYKERLGRRDFAAWACCDLTSWNNSERYEV